MLKKYSTYLRVTMATAFTRLHSCMLTGVSVTNRVLGHGSYAIVLELEYMGRKCAGKKIHEVLLTQGSTTYPIRKFENECHLLSQLHHPNIVEFLGVFFQDESLAPILVMEYLPTDLTSCIKKRGILPKETSYSILRDVAQGLNYLHNQHPPIIHRDLTSNNILLAPSMTAKISDLGVAKIIDITPLQRSHMTQTPGTPAYMPPEVMVACPIYDASVDEFSFGILMIHVFSGKWPEPQIGPNRVEVDKLIPVSEAERRRKFLEAVGDDHPLMDLILRCINNNPGLRPHTGEIVEQLVEKMAEEFPHRVVDQPEKFTITDTRKKISEFCGKATKQRSSLSIGESESTTTLDCAETRRMAGPLKRVGIRASKSVEDVKMSTDKRSLSLYQSKSKTLFVWKSKAKRKVNIM